MSDTQIYRDFRIIPPADQYEGYTIVWPSGNTHDDPVFPSRGDAEQYIDRWLRPIHQDVHDPWGS
jgi:hypothetical protein